MMTSWCLLITVSAGKGRKRGRDSCKGTPVGDGSPIRRRRIPRELTAFRIRTKPIECLAWGDCVFVERAEGGLLDLVGDDQITLSRAQPPAVQGKINKSSEFQSGSTFCRSIKSSDEMRAIMSWRPRGPSRRRSQKEEKETHNSCEITAELFDIDRGKTPKSRVEEL